MRVLITTLLLSALAIPASGAAGPIVSPAKVTIRVGEKVKLHGYQGAGFSQGFPYHYKFVSDAPAIATIEGFASGSSTTQPDPLPHNGDVFVEAAQPGVAHVRVRSYKLDLATITVRPRIGPVQIHAETTHVLPGQQVVLLAVVPGYDQPSIFSWYHGRIGDTTRPIQASNDPQLPFVATSPGRSYLWVQVFAGPVISSAEIEIETAALSRRRTARH